MKIRFARHTLNLDSIIHFYCNIIGLEILGSFKGHDGYDGVFLGIKNENWHLEFTVSDETPNHSPDEDDLIVFYPGSKTELQTMLTKLKHAEISEVLAKNPYWIKNGHGFLDPDGYSVVISNPFES